MDHNNRPSQFASLPLIDAKALVEAWPDASWHERTPTGPENESADPIQSLQAPTLRSSAFKKVLEEAVNTDPIDDLSWLASAELLVDFKRMLKQRLYQGNFNLDSTSHLTSLLCKALAAEEIIDLSPFPTLNATQIIQILNQTKCNSLDLAGSPHITPHSLREILNATPYLKSLNVMGTPNLSLSDLGTESSASGLEVQELWHSEMFSKNFEYKWEEGEEATIPSDPALLFGKISPVVQLFYAHDGWSTDRQKLPSGGLPLTRIPPPAYIHRRTKEHYPAICGVPFYCKSEIQ